MFSGLAACHLYVYHHDYTPDVNIHTVLLHLHPLRLTGSCSLNLSLCSFLNQGVLPSASMSSAQRLICKQRAVLISGTDVKHQGASDPSGLRQ